MLPLSGLIILLSLTPSLAQINSTSLAYTLLPDAAAADVSLVTGQSLPLRPFTLTVLSNASHALVSFNVSTPISKIGWLGVGWGTKMEDAAMSVLWPTQDNSAWVLSHRAAGGHSQPEYNPSLTEQSVGRFQTVADASYSARSYTVVSYLRELDLPSAQILFPSSNSQYLNLTRSNNQRLIYAYSSSRPSSDLRIATLPMHDTRSFGVSTVNLGKTYLKQVVTPNGDSGKGDGGNSGGDATVVEVDGTSSDATDGKSGNVLASAWTSYDTLIFAHAGMALIVWLLVAPAAVLIGRLARSSPLWFPLHSSLQGFLTLPATLVIVITGVVATRSAYGKGGVDLHKVLGVLLLALVCLQSGGGWLAHKAPLSSQPGSTRAGVRVAHILLGTLILVLSWVQLGLGFREYESRPRTTGITVLFVLCIFLFCAVSIVSLVLLVVARKREGRTLLAAAVGLGRASASPKHREWVGAMHDLSRPREPSLDTFDEDRRGSLSVPRRRESWSAPAAGVAR